jgi:hypothetical protein
MLLQHAANAHCFSGILLLQGYGAQQQRAPSRCNLQLQQAANLLQAPLQPLPIHLLYNLNIQL